MEKEIARRAIFRESGTSLEDLLCLHATRRDLFGKDPVFPDSMDLRRVAEASGAVARVSAKFKKDLVRLAYTRNAKEDHRKDPTEHDLDGDDREYAVKIHRGAYDRVKKIYRGERFHPDLWLAIYRYETLGLFSGMSGSVPPKVYRALKRADKRAVECFASFFNATIPGYHGLFPDVEAPFGCKGNFFAIKRMKSLMLCNPPFERCVMNAFVEHILALLEGSKGQCLAILPAFDTGHRDLLNASGKCRDAYPTDYDTDVSTERLRTSRFARWSALFCKENFAYKDMSTMHTIKYTSTLVCLLSSLDRPRDRVTDSVRRALPRPDILFGTTYSRSYKECNT